MKTGLITFFLFQALVLTGWSQSDDFRKMNVSYYYNPGAEIRLAHSFARGQDGVVLYLKITTLEGVGLRNNYSISYEFRRNYMNPEPLGRDTIPYHELLFRQQDEYIFKEKLNPPADASLILITVENLHTANSFVFDLALENEFIFPAGELLIKKNGLPVFRDFISVQDTLEIISATDTTSAPVFAYRYRTAFTPADPPMAETPRAVQEELEIDSILTLAMYDPVRLEREGLYFLQTDTATLIGSGLLARDMFYPRLAVIEDVMEPLIYITTRSERERLMKATDKKAELDRFWLNLVKSPDRAKGLIRSYFRRVKQSNNYFTTYKDGWKTDQGMIYILFGPPDEVYRDEEKEEWIYKKIEDIPSLSFTFVKVKNIFSRDHYALLRDVNYEQRWYRIVDLWRKGRFASSEAN